MHLQDPYAYPERGQDPPDDYSDKCRYAAPLTGLLDLVERDKAEDQPENGPDETKPTQQRADQGYDGHQVDTGPLHRRVTRRLFRQGGLLDREAHTLLRMSRVARSSY